MNDGGQRSSVRIELDDSGESGAIAPAPAAPASQPLALIVLLVGLAAGFVGLLAISGGGAVDDSAEEEQVDAPLIGDLRLSDEERVWIGDVPLFGVVVEGINGWYGTSGELLYTADGPIGWERVDVGGGRVLDAASVGDGVNVLVAMEPTAGSATSATQLQIRRSTDGVVWKVFDEFVVPERVHDGSLNGRSWAVLAGPGDAPAGDDATAIEQVEDRVWTAGASDTVRLRLADNDRVRAHVAVADGAIAISSTVDFFSTPSGIELPTRLLRLTADESVDITPTDADLDGGSRLVRSGDGTIWLIDGLRAWAATAPYDDWMLYADASELSGVNRLDPILNGGGVIASADEPDAGGFHLSTGNGTWEAFTFPGVSELGVLLIDDGELTISAVVDGTRQVTIARAIDQTRRPQILATPVADGEWDLPVLAAGTGDRGFVGLTNINGSIGWFESDDGLSWETTTPTNLPFGFFANQLETTETGWLAIGKVGLLEDAAFASFDGTDWTRLKFELPRGATAVELDAVSTSTTANAFLGSLGWADDLSRTERFLLWAPAGGRPVDVPFRPCPETQGVCTIRSIAVVGDGLLATHLADQRYTVSRWTEADGWAQLGIDQPLPDDAVSIQRGSHGITYLGQERVLRSDTGTIWYELFDAVDGVGPYLAVSNRGSTAIAAAGDALVVRSSAGDLTYAAPDVQFGSVLAIDAGAAIVRAITPDGPALARLDAAAAERTVVDVSPASFERAGVDPDRPSVLLSAFDGRLHELRLDADSTDEWTPVAQGEVGAGRILDLSIGDAGLLLLSATSGSGEGEDETTWISVSRRSGEVWEWLGTTEVPLEVSRGSLNGTAWIVQAGPTLTTEDLGTADQLVNDLSSWLYAGSAGDAEATRIPTGASELVVEAESTGGGAMFLSVDLDFFVSSPPSLQLKRWEPEAGITIVQPGGRSVTEDDHLWLNAEGTILLSRDREIWAATAPYDGLVRSE